MIIGNDIMNKIPDWYLPLMEKMSKNLNEEELQILQDMVNWKSVDPSIMKKLLIKMTWNLTKWEKMKLIWLCSYLSIKWI